jgi:hypothetical protein
MRYDCFVTLLHSFTTLMNCKEGIKRFDYWISKIYLRLFMFILSIFELHNIYLIRVCLINFYNINTNKLNTIFSIKSEIFAYIIWDIIRQ